MFKVYLKTHTTNSAILLKKGVDGKALASPDGEQH